jgi:O-antigen/teichoic acid export membrane protein
MAKPIAGSDVFWGYIAAGFNLGAGIILLPLILHFLPAESVAMWIVFATLVSLTQLMELGFQPTIARYAAYIYAGSQQIEKIGLPIVFTAHQEINSGLLDSLVENARFIYRFITLVAGLIMFVGGTIYINTLITQNQSRSECLTAWIVYASGYVFNFYYGYLNGLIQGRGDVTGVNKITIVSRITLIITSAITLFLGYGLLGLGFASLLASIVGRVLSNKLFHKKYEQNFSSLNTQQINSKKNLLASLWHNASRLGIVNIGAFLILKGNVLVASSVLGLSEASSYAITLTILSTLSGVSMVICQIQIPHMSALQVKKDRRKLAIMYGEIQLISLSVYIVGLVLLSVVGPDLLQLLHSRATLLPGNLLLLYGLVMLLELNHSIAGSYIATTNRLPFVTAAIISGLVIAILSVFAARHFGLLGIILTQGVVQAAFNNWKWPLVAAKDLNVGVFSVYRLGYDGLKNKLKINIG